MGCTLWHMRTQSPEPQPLPTLSSVSCLHPGVGCALPAQGTVRFMQFLSLSQPFTLTSNLDRNPNQVLVDWLSPKEPGRAQSDAAILVAGGLAGMISLGSVHPVDVVKSKIQTLPLGTPVRERAVWHVVTTGLQEQGVQFFMRGFAAAQIRAFVLNAACFYGFGVSARLLEPLSI